MLKLIKKGRGILGWTFSEVGGALALQYTAFCTLDTATTQASSGPCYCAQVARNGFRIQCISFKTTIIRPMMLDCTTQWNIVFIIEG